MKYKVLTLTPPWGTLIAIGAKNIETRSWGTSFRGPLLIHQGSNLKPIGGEQGLRDTCFDSPFFEALRAGSAQGPPFSMHHEIAALPRGAIVAVCELVGCRRTDEREAQIKGGWFGSISATTMHFWELTDQERAFGDYSPGRWAWLLAEIRALPAPTCARGMPGLWDWEGELEL